MATTFYYDKVSSGNMYIGTTAVGGVTIPVYNATGQTFGLWNPAGSGKNLVLVSADLGIISGTPVVGNFTLSYQTNMGSAIAANNPITAGTLGTPVNALLGGQQNSVSRFFPATVTLANAPSLLITLGTGQGTTSLAAGMQTVHYDFYDKIVLAPGSFVGQTGNAAPGTVCDITWYWYEQ